MIYLIQDTGTRYVKIGHCQCNPALRREQLQVGCPSELRLIHTAMGDRRDEELLHRRFHGVRIRGEWFALTEEDIALLKSKESLSRTLNAEYVEDLMLEHFIRKVTERLRIRRVAYIHLAVRERLARDGETLPHNPLDWEGAPDVF